jgi:adenosylhomocysteinase
MNKVKDMKLAAQGQAKLAWAEQEMPVLASIRKEFAKSKPFKGVKLAVCLHVTKETGVLVRTLAAGGAKLSVCGSNPLSTQDDVAAALAKEGVEIFAWKHQTNKEYYECLNRVLDSKPQITMDDGADLVSLIHSERPDLLKTIYAGQEETTTGVIRLRAMAKDGQLKYPIIAINDTPTKHLFDNYYGTGQSTLDAILRSTNILMAGKKIVVAGYGHCGRGVGLRAKGLGASRVIITEVDPLPALQAVMDGFEVMPMQQAAKIGDVFITVTGDKDVITVEHMKLMNDRAIVSNSGHFNVEIDVAGLEKFAKSKKAVSPVIDEYTLPGGNRVYLLAGGRLVNLAAAEGHPSSVMDMSFSDQALTCEWIVKNHKTLTPGVHEVPGDIDIRVASLKLASMGVKIDKLTPEQKHYLSSWQEGT